MRPQIILHHYPESPFSEKIRLALALKKLPYTSVIVPLVVDGREDTMSLVGGYRRIPILQIGADFYCDTACILRELERRFPTPSLVPQNNGLSYALARWTDTFFFQSMVGLMPWDHLPEFFVKDREDMFGGLSKSVTPETKPYSQRQLAVSLDWLESILADGRQWILDTAAPSHGDIHASMNVWWLENLGLGFDEALYPSVHKWLKRLYEVAGDTTTSAKTITQAEAVAIARQSQPEPSRPWPYPDSQGLKQGDIVAVTPTDSAKRTVVGKLEFICAQEVVIRRTIDNGGKFDTVIHFPVLNFAITPVKPNAKL